MQHSESQFEPTTARHEFGHAVMYWIMKDYFPDVTVLGKRGFCEQSATGLTVVEDLLYTLGGPAAEVEYHARSADLATSRTHDLQYCRNLISSRWNELPGICDHDGQGLPTEREIEAKLSDFFVEACDTLWNYRDLIDYLVDELLEKRDSDSMIGWTWLTGAESLRIAGHKTNWCIPDGESHYDAPEDVL